MPKKKVSESKSTANIGFEAKLWLAADKLRNNMDAAEYKHVVLGLIFLKYAEEVEDDGEPFEEKMTRLVTELNSQFAESDKLEKAIKANLKGLGLQA
jgi:type I restriction enzyme M protein